MVVFSGPDDEPVEVLIFPESIDSAASVGFGSAPSLVWSGAMPSASAGGLSICRMISDTINNVPIPTAIRILDES